MRVIFIICFALLLSLVASQNARGFVLKKSLHDAIKKSLPGLFAFLKSLEIEDVKGDTKVPVIGTVDYHVKDIKIADLSAGDFQLSIKNPDHISTAVLNANFGATVKFEAKQRSFPRMSAKGKITAKSKEFNLVLEASVTKKNDKLHFKSKVVMIHLGKIDVKVSGGGFAGWLINMMVSLFKTRIQESIQKAMKEALIEAIDKDLNEIIQNTPHIIPFGDKVALNLGMKEIGFITEEYIHGAVFGEFYEPKGKFSKQLMAPLPTRPLNNRTGQVYVSPNLFKSGAETFVKSGMLKATINAEDVPDESPLKLNTKSLSNYIPELYSKFPDHDLQVKIDVQKVPTFEISEEGLFVKLSSFFEMNVKTANGFVKAFNADFSFDGGALLGVKPAGGRNYNITGEIKKVIVGMKLKESFMGDLDLSRMERFLNIVIVRGMIASANRQLKDGYTVEMPEVPETFGLKNILIEYRPQYLAASADAIFENQDSIEYILQFFEEPKHHQKLNSIMNMQSKKF
eukprot:gene3095-5265_t